MEDVMAYLERPWMKKVLNSKYMVDLLRYLRVGRKISSILAKFSDIPEAYVLGALEALEKLGVVRKISVGGEDVYVLSDSGKVLLAQVEELLKPSV